MLNSTCRTILVCKLLQNVNFDGLAFLTAVDLYNQSDYLNHCSVLYESIEHADEHAFVRFGNKLCFEN